MLLPSGTPRLRRVHALLKEFKPLKLRDGPPPVTAPSATPKRLTVGRSFLG